MACSQLWHVHITLSVVFRDLPYVSSVADILFCSGGLMRIGEPNMLTRITTTDVTLINGFNGRRNYWGFAFQSDSQLWALEDTGTYTRATPFVESRPVYTRLTVGTAVVGWTYVNALTGWREDAAGKVYIADACYSLDGKVDGRIWRVFTASRSRLYVVTPSTSTVSVLASAPAGLLYRGLVVSPFAAGAPPARTASNTVAPAVSATTTATKSKKAK